MLSYHHARRCSSRRTIATQWLGVVTSSSQQQQQRLVSATMPTTTPGMSSSNGSRAATTMMTAIAVASRHKLRLDDARLLSDRAMLDDLRVAVVFPKTRSAGRRQTVPVEVLVLENRRGAHLALFNDGTRVSFGMSDGELRRADHALRGCRDQHDDVAWLPVASGTSGSETMHRMNVTTAAQLAPMGYIAPETGESYIDEGTLNAIVLKDSSIESMLPFMYCLSRRVQIDAIAAALKPVAEQVREWRTVVRQKGTLPFEVKDCRKRKAKVTRLKAAQTRIVARPQIFTDGDYHHLRQMYGLAHLYFELPERTEALRSSLEGAAEALTYLSNEANARTNHRLEIVICVLIGVEILCHLLH